MGSTDGIVIGRVLRPWGRRGEMVIESLTHDRSRFSGLGEVLVRLRGRVQGRRVRSVKLDSAQRPLLAFEGIDDISAAEALRGAELLVAPAEVLRPQDDHTFLNDELIGLEVVTITGIRLGRVDSVVDGPGASLFALRDSGGREILIPAVRQFIIEVDIPGGRLLVDLPAGLCEINVPGDSDAL